MIGLIQKAFKKKGRSPQTPSLELQDIQGIVLFSYKHLSHSSYLILRVDHPAAAKQWLHNHLSNNRITSAKWPTKPSANDPNKAEVIRPQTAMNIALTSAGIQILASSKTLQESFPLEFQQGMQHPERSRRIGDYEGTCNHSSHWEEYWQPQAETESSPVHTMVLLQATETDMPEFEREILDSIETGSGLSLLSIERGYLPTNQREHFGFRDAISQPSVKGRPISPKSKPIDYDAQLTKAGEFVLGYLNEDGNYPQTRFVLLSEDLRNDLAPLPDRSKRDFGRNGSFLVYRKLEQDVAGLRRYVHEGFETPKMGQKMVAKMVGRWPSGVSLVESPDFDPGCEDARKLRNDFTYRNTDPQGSRCPFAAHVRRMNPRDSKGDNAADAIKASQRRRILRRGTLYGDPLPENQLDSDGQDRGLHFFCLNASIRRQFEFIQQSWVNNPKFHGLYQERDPLIGINPDGSNLTMTVPDQTGMKKLSIPNFVTVKGGAYFFVPSLSALAYLSRPNAQAEQ